MFSVNDEIVYVFLTPTMWGRLKREYGEKLKSGRCQHGVYLMYPGLSHERYVRRKGEPPSASLTSQDPQHAANLPSAMLCTATRP